jgi:hypothetical protein
MADESNVMTGADTDGGIGRRSLIKKAAAAGVAVWSAPLIMESKVAAAATGTGEIEPDKCYKYQYNWWYTTGAANNVPDNGTAGNLSHNLMLKFNAQTPDFPAKWNEECQFSDDDGTHLAGWQTNTSKSAEIYKSNGAGPNAQCCKDSSPPLNQPYDWWQNGPGPQFEERIRTFPTPECVTITPTCGSPGTGDGFTAPETIVFTLAATGPCALCWFADPSLWYTADPASTTPSITTTNQGGRRSKTITITFPSGSSRFPVYLKTWIACGSTVNFTSCNIDPIVMT